MPRILTTTAKIICPHGGLGVTIPSSTKWRINSGYVAVENDVGVMTCPFLPFRCNTYQLQSMGLNSSRIDGRRVILETDFNQTDTGLPLLMIETHKVKDESTVAPIPAGQSAPPPPPELADLVAPIVTAAPPSASFVSSPPGPPVVVTFTLASAHPKTWVLTLISRTKRQSFNLTNGIPGQVDVQPGAGQWTTPVLTVKVTFSPPFLVGLGVGLQDLYMTGVSRRGLSSYGLTLITVT